MTIWCSKATRLLEFSRSVSLDLRTWIFVTRTRNCVFYWICSPLIPIGDIPFNLVQMNVLLCLQHLATSVSHLLEPRIATMPMVAMVALSKLHLFPTAAAASVTLT